jgi:hypothetical protein
MRKTKIAAEELAEMIRDGLAEEGHDVQVHRNPETGWDVAVVSANEAKDAGSRAEAIAASPTVRLGEVTSRRLGSSESSVVEYSQILLNGPACGFWRKSFLALHALLAVGVRLDQAGIDRKAFAANRTVCDAALQDRLKDAPQEIALAETAMPVLREGGMIVDIAVESEPADHLGRNGRRRRTGGRGHRSPKPKSVTRFDVGSMPNQSLSTPARA